MYGNNRIVIPPRGRYALMQAAHAATHQGLGSPLELLKRSFYWPYMHRDVNQYEQACRAVHAAVNVDPDLQNPVVAPDTQPGQATPELGPDQTNVDLSIPNEEESKRRWHLIDLEIQQMKERNDLNC